MVRSCGGTAFASAVTGSQVDAIDRPGGVAASHAESSWLSTSPIAPTSPIQRGFLYLVAIGLGDAPVLSWRLFWILRHGRYGQPEIFNSGQPVRLDFTGCSRTRASAMDGRGRCMDNIFIDSSIPYHRRLPRRTIRVDRLLQHRAAPFVPRRFEAYGAAVDMMDKARGPHPHTQQQQQDVIKRWQHDQTTEYTLTALPNCPTKWDQLMCRHVIQHNFWHGFQNFLGHRVTFRVTVPDA